MKYRATFLEDFLESLPHPAAAVTETGKITARNALFSTRNIESETWGMVVDAVVEGECGVIAISDREFLEILSRPIESDQGPVSILLQRCSDQPRESHRMFCDEQEEGVSLDHREVNVIECLVRGATNIEIAAEMEVSEALVKKLLRRLFSKTGSVNRTKLALWYLRRLEENRVTYK